MNDDIISKLTANIKQKAVYWCSLIPVMNGIQTSMASNLDGGAIPIIHNKMKTKIIYFRNRFHLSTSAFVVRFQLCEAQSSGASEVRKTRVRQLKTQVPKSGNLQGRRCRLDEEVTSSS